MDREKWQQPLIVDNAPAYPCPHCKLGTVQLVKTSVDSSESPESQADREHEAWDIDWITEHFSCFFRRSNLSCGGGVYAIATQNARSARALAKHVRKAPGACRTSVAKTSYATWLEEFQSLLEDHEHVIDWQVLHMRHGPTGLATP